MEDIRAGDPSAKLIVICIMSYRKPAERVSKKERRRQILIRCARGLPFTPFSGRRFNVLHSHYPRCRKAVRYKKAFSPHRSDAPCKFRLYFVCSLQSGKVEISFENLQAGDKKGGERSKAHRKNMGTIATPCILQPSCVIPPPPDPSLPSRTSPLSPYQGRCPALKSSLSARDPRGLRRTLNDSFCPACVDT